MESRIYGYARCSTKEQNVFSQLESFKEFEINERDIYIDAGISGKDFNREQYNILKKVLRKNDLLVIKSIDRLGRNYEQIINEWQDIVKNIGADIVVLDMALLDTRQNKDLLGTFISDLVLQILSYVAEQERIFIKQRQRVGIDICLKQGKKYGRPKIDKPSNWNEVISKWKNKELMTKEEVIEHNKKWGIFPEKRKMSAEVRALKRKKLGVAMYMRVGNNAEGKQNG